MKGFPYVVGTDIAHLTRFHPLPDKERFRKIAARILHLDEYQALKKQRPSHYNFLVPSPIQTDSSLHRQDDLSRPNQSCNSTSTIEQTASSQESDPEITHTTALRMRNWLGGRWAAKEAARKAWGANLIGFKDVQVVSDWERNSRVRAEASPAVKVLCQPLGRRLKGERQEGQLSISHDGDYAVATVIAEVLRDDMRKLLEIRDIGSKSTDFKHLKIGDTSSPPRPAGSKET